MTIKDKEAIDFAKCRNVLIPRLDTFGDIVLLQGFIAALLEYLPEARITLLVRQGYEQLASMFPGRLLWKTTRIHPYRKPYDYQEIKSFLEELKKESYDLLLTTTYNRTWPDDLLALALADSQRVAIGDPQPISPDAAEVWAKYGGIPNEGHYDLWVPVEGRIHETEKYQSLWSKIAPGSKSIPQPHLIIPQEESNRASDVIARAGLKEGEFVFCFPAGVANIKTKVWPANNYAEVIYRLEKNHSLRSLVAGHVSEKSIVDEVVGLARKLGANAAGWLGTDGNISLAGALADKSLFYFGNDTSLMHMAAALKKPVVAIFGGGTWPRFLPAAKISRVFTTSMPCFYCMWNCIFDRPFCINWVKVDIVEKEMAVVLEEIHTGNGTGKVLQQHPDSLQSIQILEKSVECLMAEKDKLKISEADRAARLEVIHGQQNALDSLRQQLEASEADRAARLEVIHGQQNALDSLRQQLEASEADRAARLEVIHGQQEALDSLRQQLETSEADRAARLEAIREKDEQLIKASDEYKRLREGYSYRIGHLILWPLKKILNK